MTDYGIQFYLEPDTQVATAYQHNIVSKDWGTAFWKGSSTEVTEFQVRFSHSLTFSIQEFQGIKEPDVSPIVVLEHSLVTQFGGTILEAPLVPGPLPGGVSVGTVVRAFPAPRQPGSYLPPTSVTQMLPALKELEAIITGMHLRKAEHYTKFSQYVDALIKFTEANEITEAINLQFPYKTWHRFPYDSVRDALTKMYTRKESEKLALALQQWSEQHQLDEEANWRAIEIWADGLAPKYDYG